MLTVDEKLRVRHWIMSNIDMMLDECYYHRDNSIHYERPKAVIWQWDQQESRQKIPDETTG